MSKYAILGGHGFWCKGLQGIAVWGEVYDYWALVSGFRFRDHAAGLRWFSQHCALGFWPGTLELGMLHNIFP